MGGIKGSQTICTELHVDVDYKQADDREKGERVQQYMQQLSGTARHGPSRTMPNLQVTYHPYTYSI